VEALDMQTGYDETGERLHILKSPINELINSDKHKEVRLLNVQNPKAWSPHCDCCENREMMTDYDRSHKNTSRRVFLMDMESPETEQNYSNFMNSNGSVDWYPNSLDIRFGNLCNQKCIMCNPQFSNLWYDEHFEYHNTDTYGSTRILKAEKINGKWKGPTDNKWFEDPIWWAKFEQMMPHLTHLYITGGEPMIVPAHDEMLDRLINSGFAKNIWLEYDSNCSAINHKIIERWSYFKKVDIRASMDALGDQYELIRFGGKWNKFVENIHTLKEYEAKSNGQLNLQRITTCFQMSTIYSIIESEKWCNELGVPFLVRFLEGPARHRVASLPNEFMLELIEYFSKHTDQSEKAKLIVTHLKNHIDSGLENIEAVKDFIKFMDYLDTTRNTNWKQTLPEVSELVNRVVNK
jgi:hypothetical protein